MVVAACMIVCTYLVSRFISSIISRSIRRDDNPLTLPLSNVKSREQFCIPVAEYRYATGWLKPNNKQSNLRKIMGIHVTKANLLSNVMQKGTWCI